jgi:hypothetical protein
MTMKRLMTLTLAAAVATLAIPVLAQTSGTNPSSPTFVDKDGDGICDTYQAGGQGQAKGKGSGKGPGNGTGNQGVGPRDGSGYGAGYGAGTCTGTCDGTGPKGQRRGKGRS